MISVSRHSNIKNYGYRKARMNNVMIILPRDKNQPLEDQLAKFANVRKDNHVLYTLTMNGTEICVQMEDQEIWIGTGLVEEPW